MPMGFGMGDARNKRKIKGSAVRVPVIVGSSTELYCNIEKQTTIEEINATFKSAAENSLKIF